MPKHPVTPFHLRAKERAEIVPSPDELRARIADKKTEALKSLALATGMLRIQNPTAKLCRAAIAHIREAELASDMCEEGCRQLERMTR